MLQVIAPAEWEPAVGDVSADGRASRCDCLGRCWDVRVEVLKTQDLRVRARGRSDPVDVKADDVGEALSAELLNGHDHSVLLVRIAWRRGLTTMFRRTTSP
jgi:hypothetical protein